MSEGEGPVQLAQEVLATLLEGAKQQGGVAFEADHAPAQSQATAGPLVAGPPPFLGEGKVADEHDTAALEEEILLGRVGAVLDDLRHRAQAPLHLFRAGRRVDEAADLAHRFEFAFFRRKVSMDSSNTFQKERSEVSEPAWCVWAASESHRASVSSVCQRP